MKQYPHPSSQSSEKVAVLTWPPPRHTTSAALSLLRSKLFVAIVSLFVLTGYAHAVSGRCCADAKPGQIQHGKPGSTKNHRCQGLCHQIFSNDSAEPVLLPVVALVSQARVCPGKRFLPDTEPQRIDHPPQLA